MRERAADAARLRLQFSEGALAIRWKIVAAAESMAALLGTDCPRSLREFIVYLRPHGDERKALASWPTVQVDLDTVLALRRETESSSGSESQPESADQSSAASKDDGNPTSESQEESAESIGGSSGTAAPINAGESLRSKYHDPDNYWRNVWLYRQRKPGKTNPVIREELGECAAEYGYAPLVSENALRDAIESIADFHGWPRLKGKPGRPKSSRGSGSASEEA